MKRYLCRYVHHIDGLPDFSALRFTKYNQYESIILLLQKYLENHGVKIEYGINVKNVIIENQNDRKSDKQIIFEKDGEENTIDLIEDDLVFITNRWSSINIRWKTIIKNSKKKIKGTDIELLLEESGLFEEK